MKIKSYALFHNLVADEYSVLVHYESGSVKEYFAKHITDFPVSVQKNALRNNQFKEVKFRNGTAMSGQWFERMEEA